MVWGLKVALGSGFDGTVSVFSVYFSVWNSYNMYVFCLKRERKLKLAYSLYMCKLRLLWTYREVKKA